MIIEILNIYKVYVFEHKFIAIRKYIVSIISIPKINCKCRKIRVLVIIIIPIIRKQNSKPKLYRFATICAYSKHVFMYIYVVKIIFSLMLRVWKRRLSISLYNMCNVAF